MLRQGVSVSTGSGAAGSATRHKGASAEGHWVDNLVIRQKDMTSLALLQLPAKLLQGQR